jgi:hypothetical protein
LLRYKDESLKLKKKPRMQIIKSLKRRMGRRKLKVQMLERDADLEEEEVSERCGIGTVLGGRSMLSSPSKKCAGSLEPYTILYSHSYQEACFSSGMACHSVILETTV